MEKANEDVSQYITELQELRKWAAKFMGWSISNNLSIDTELWERPDGELEWHGSLITCSHMLSKMLWRPDDHMSGQIWLIINRLEKIYKYCTWCIDSDYDQVLDGLGKFQCQVALVKDYNDNKTILDGTNYTDNLNKINYIMLLTIKQAIEK